ncbi:MAG TPA: DUF1376 domain-containing protein [Xylella fastidiosa subsp. pauca]
MNYFELYPGDYLWDTAGLSLIEHGAYLKLLLDYYMYSAAFACRLERSIYHRLRYYSG